MSHITMEVGQLYKKFLTLAVISMLLVAGCSKVAFNNKTIDKQTKNNSASTADKNQLNEQLYGINYEIIKQGIPIAISRDKTYVYIMERLDNKENGEVIKGADITKIRLSRLDVEIRDNKITKLGKKKTIIESLPFISTVKWNLSGDIIGFLGGTRLTIYNQKTDKLIKQQELENNPVTYFGWDPTGKIIYTEHPNLVNGTIISIDEEKITHAYETNEQIYYKGNYNKDLYYGTKRCYKSDEEAKKTGISEIINTVILDKNKKIVKELPKGRFRDSYMNSMIQTGMSGFGLEYYEDINNPNKVKTLTNEYVYDAKFVHSGKIVYITKELDYEKNNFLLFVADTKGNIVSKQIVSSSSIALAIDGKKGYGSGKNSEVINFNTYKIDRNTPTESKYEELYNIIRGAMDVYYKHEIIGQADFVGAKKYFIDTENPDQFAYFDVLQRLNSIKYSQNSKYYNITIRIDKVKLNNDKASVKLGIGAENSFGTGMGIENALELIKVNGKWIITGLSTFPDSKQAAELRKIVEKEVKNIQDKKLYNGKLTGKNVSIGQIQFWQLSEPHLASDVENANFCKVYLKVNENNKEVIYKMVLDKKYQKSWKSKELSNEYLWGL